MPIPESEADALRVAYASTRDILRARDGAMAQRALVAMCRALGAEVVPADDGHPDAIPLDVSLGESDPLVPVSADPRVRGWMSSYVAPAVFDAQLTVERGLSSERMIRLATHDPLTGLWNRRSLDLSIDRARPGDCIAVLDLDNFKLINDIHGHAQGDAVLEGFARHLTSAVRDRDVVGRLGGEEFVIVLPATPLAESCAVLGRIRASWPESAPLDVTFSAGVAPVTDGQDPRRAGRSALEAADALLYEAKLSGRDRIACPSP